MVRIDLGTIQELLRHFAVKVAEQYSHLSPDHRAGMVGLLDFETKLKQGQRHKVTDNDRGVPNWTILEPLWQFWENRSLMLFHSWSPHIVVEKKSPGWGRWPGLYSDLIIFIS
jgi:hypothetical protein